jgi:hypothetical protein
MPNGYKKMICYNDSDNKISLIKQEVLKYWEDYLLSHWIWLGKFKQGKLNYEDKTKSLLDKCATFLMLSNFKKYDILSDNKRNQMYDNEILLSCASDDIKDAIYSINIEDEEITQTPRRSSAIITNEILSGNKQYTQEVKIHKKRLPKIIKRYKQSQQYKIKKLYSVADKIVKELYKFKNGDLQEKPLNKELSEEELIKWQQKPFKNIHGENVYEYRVKIIKGHPGLIDSTLPYLWAWCYANTDNEFEFSGQKYKIDNEVEQYSGRVVVDRHGEEDIIYDMDMILCYEQNGVQFYFDQKIDRIDNKYIKQI